LLMYDIFGFDHPQQREVSSIDHLSTLWLHRTDLELIYLSHQAHAHLAVRLRTDSPRLGTM
jgi:hypothetical protein